MIDNPIMAIVFGGLLVMMIGIFTIAAMEEMNLPKRLKDRRRRKTERGLPIYERLARAEEREAEQHLDWGNTDLARQHYREAQRIRTEATEAMMKGEQPPL